jgi:hypothetical protein
LFNEEHGIAPGIEAHGAVVLSFTADGNVHQASVEWRGAKDEGGDIIGCD